MSLVPESIEIHSRIAALPLCDLHYIETGSGPPLIMVPATMSEVQDWAGLAAFMGQRFKVFFFELPGHGRSTPLKRYSSERVAQVIADFLDHLGFAQANLMGFSFGGILTLAALGHLVRRIDKVILISPLIDSSALCISPFNKLFLRGLVQITQSPGIQKAIHRSLQSDIGSTFWAQFSARAGNVEHPDRVKENLRATPLCTIQVLTKQMDEIFNTHRFAGSAHYTHPCYFVMSDIDPLIDFSFTLAALRQMFPNIDETRLHLPYHQPRELPTLDFLNRTYPHLLNKMGAFQMGWENGGRRSRPLPNSNETHPNKMA
jgi:pimeloyl-ACP methyl ester carboxylesterase